MATCACGTQLPGRRQKCDPCKQQNRPARPATPNPPAKKSAPRAARKSTPKRPAARRNSTAAAAPAPAKKRTRSTKPATKAPAKKATKKSPASTPSNPDSSGSGEKAIVYPDGLHRRGRRLWKSLGHDIDTPGGELALEACRMADRLEELDRVIAGKGVLNLMSFRLNLDLVDEATGDRNINVKVEFSGVLTEGRLQQDGFKKILAELGATRVKGTGAFGGEQGAPPTQPTPAPPTANPLDEVNQRRQARAQTS